MSGTERMQGIGTNRLARRRWKLLGVVAIVMALLAGACSSDSGGKASGGGEKKLAGKVTIDGSSTLEPISSAVAEEFQGEAPNVDVVVRISGTGGGFEKFCRGEIDIADASRPVKDEEKAACQAKGIEFVELAVAYDGLAIVANKDVSWLDCVTTDQLKKIWDQGSTVGSWKDVDTKLPSEKIALFGPGTDSGTFDYFTSEINGVEGQSRSDYTPSEDDNVLVTGVSGQKGALGYFGLAYYEKNKDKLKGLEVSGSDGTCVAPTTDTVQSGEYPLARPLYIYVNKAAFERAEVKSFIEFYLDSVSDLVREVGYVPLTEELLDESRSSFESAI